MKRRLSSLLILLSALPLALHAQEAPSIAVVDLQQVLENYDQAQQADTELRQQQQRVDAELQPIVESIEALRQDRQELIGRINSPSISEQGQREARTQLQELEAELQQAAAEFQQLRDEARQTLGQRRNNMLSMMLDDIRGASSEVARQQGVDLVLNAQAEIVLYSADNLDLTQRVIDELNNGGD